MTKTTATAQENELFKARQDIKVVCIDLAIATIRGLETSGDIDREMSLDLVQRLEASKRFRNSTLDFYLEDGLEASTRSQIDITVKALEALNMDVVETPTGTGDTIVTVEVF